MHLLEGASNNDFSFPYLWNYAALHIETYHIIPKQEIWPYLLQNVYNDFYINLMCMFYNV